jgi:predicted alpha/beta hydrolase family esterase
MQKKAIIFHGTLGSPDVCWYPWLGKQLEMRGYSVEIPYYQDINMEPIQTFLPKVLASHTFDEHTVLIGHSAGAALLLSILEHIDTPVAQAILVAGYSTRPNTYSEPVLQENYNWEKIRSHVKDIYFINSVTDPYNCDAKQGRVMFDHLGGTQIIRDEGHFGSEEQDYETFELLERLIS